MGWGSLMPIRSLIQSAPETIQGFEAAAEEKYEDGFNLLASDSPGSGVYLMGYAAEMLLKSAYFRIAGLGVNTPITRQELAQARAEATRLGVSTDAEHFHNVAFWSELIIKKRLQQSRGLALPLTTELDLRSRRLAQNWFVEMRYHFLQGVTAQDLEDVLDDVVWIKSSHEELWR